MSDDDEMVTLGFNLNQDVVDDLDELKREWDARENRTISRSEVARESLDLGTLALELIDDEYDRYMTSRERREIVRSALIEFFRADRERSSE